LTYKKQRWLIAIKYAMLTQPGNRDVNEDSAIIIERGGNWCFVVADGLGGHGKGEIASQTVVATFERELSPDEQSAAGFLGRAFAAAQDSVTDKQKAMGARFEMKTTAVALAIINGKCAWGHVGDSRLYMFNKNKIQTRTLDHSVPQMLALSGEIREKKIRGHPDRNMLLRAIGVQWDSPMYEVSDEADASGCQAFLLCSDGFWELIDEKHMRDSLKKQRGAEDWLRSMAGEVEKNGAGRDMDNYTAITVTL